jgi:hypothetical protein
MNCRCVPGAVIILVFAQATRLLIVSLETEFQSGIQIRAFSGIRKFGPPEEAEALKKTKIP